MNKRPRDDPLPSAYGSASKRQYGAGTPTPPPPPPAARHGRGGYDAQHQQGYSDKRNSARRVADHYSARSNQTLEERENSPIIHLKKLNNWIKSVLIQLYARPGDCVLDLACGKGSDLIKWDKAKVGNYVGVDIAKGSIKDCMTRYNGDTDQQRRKKFSFPARLICTDCYEAHLDKYLYEDAPFDICSCQLRDWNLGTVFIGLALVKSMLKRNSRHPDLLVSSTSFTWRMLSIAQNELFHSISSNYWQRRQIDAWRLLHIVANALQYGLELVLVKNFHEFVHEYLQKTEFTELMRMMGALGEGRQEQRQPPTQRRASNANRGKMFLSEGDIEYLEI